MDQINTEFYTLRRHWLSKGAVQLMLGAGFGVGLPALIATLFSSEASTPILVNSAVASLAASTIGFVAFRKFNRFPGLSSLENLIPAITVSYLTVIAVLFFARVEYARHVMLVSFLASTLVYAAVYVAARRKSRYVFAVVPLGATAVVRSMVENGYRFHFLSGPHDSDTGWDGLIADFRETLPPEWERLLVSNVLRGVPVYHLKDFVERLTGRVDIEHLSENTLASFNQHGYLQLRSLCERLIAALALLILWPFMLLVALSIRLNSVGPAIFAQWRVGYRGKRFRVFKFRTMVNSPRPAAEETTPRSRAITKANDERITSLGRILRKARIDELPQLWNILKGDMSFIGPRPEAVPLSDWYETELPFYTYRHMVRPGLTGWAQVSQGHVTELGAIHDKLRYDFYYIKHLSLWLDLLILLRTIRIVLTGYGAR
ncbi:MAG TPA: sugar transferase [Lacipirellulaceae bacterium]|nr:sugar transferase [Lacipirellulaceae bacterium]